MHVLCICPIGYLLYCNFLLRSQIKNSEPLNIIMFCKIKFISSVPESHPMFTDRVTESVFNSLIKFNFLLLGKSYSANC